MKPRPDYATLAAAIGLALVLALTKCAAATIYYIDSDYTGGSEAGSAAAPWTNIVSGWAVINAGLTNGDVTLRFSARKASSDVDQPYDSNGNGVPLSIDLTAKTTNEVGVLFMDGKGYWNTNDAAGSWLPYTGTAMSLVDDIQSQDCNHVPHDNITVSGFRIRTALATKCLTIAGDNFTVQYCDMAHTVTGSSGPGLYLIGTADGAHEGSSCWCPVVTNITIISNIVHDTYGEAIYLGGGGSNPGEAGSGYPSHSGILVAFNEVYSAGSRGAQGDGIDIKGGLNDVIIRGNNIHALNFAGSIRAIVSQGQTNGATGTRLTIERNYIHDSTGIGSEAIDIVDSWGVPEGVVIRNNIISKISGPGASGLRPGGIGVATTQDQVAVQNNTIYSVSGFAVSTGYTNSSVLLRNNLYLSNNTNGPQVSLVNAVIDSDFNAYNNTLGYGSEGSNSLSLTAQQVATSVISPSMGNFQLYGTGSLVAVGQVQSGFSNDFAGSLRTVPWDISAYSFSGLPGVPPSVTVTASNAAVYLTWGVASGTPPVAGYYVYRGYASGGAVFLAATDQLLYTDTDVTNGVPLVYQVAATNSTGVGLRSQEFFVTPSAPTVPTAPQALTAVAGSTYVALSWVAPASDGGASVTNYSVLRSTTSGAETHLAFTGNPSYTDSAVSAGTTYWYVVKALNSQGTSAASGEVSATPTIAVLRLGGRAKVGGKGRLK